MFMKWLCVFLAVLVMVTSLPWIAGFITLPPFGGTATEEVASDDVLKVALSSRKDKCGLLGKMEFTATITNISSSTVENVSAEALFGKDIKPLKRNGEIATTKASLAPGESFQLHYSAVITGFKGIDVLIAPCAFAMNLLRGAKLPVADNGFDDGRTLLEVSKGIEISSVHKDAYDASTTVRVWYGESITSGYTQQELSNMKTVRTEVVALGSSNEFTEMSIEERVEAFRILLESLADRGLVRRESIRFSPSLDHVTFRDTTGSNGIIYGIPLVGRVPMYNGSESSGTTIDENERLSVTNTTLGTAFSSSSMTSEAISNALILWSFDADPQYQKDEYIPGIGSYRDFRRDFYENLEESWKNSGLQTTRIMSAKVADFKKMADYDLIVFSGHGNIEYGEEDYPVWITSEVISDENLQLYNTCLDQHRIGETINLFGNSDDVFYYTIFPKAITEWYDNNELEGSIIFSESCKFMGADFCIGPGFPSLPGEVSEEFPNAFLCRGAETVIGFYNPVHAEYGREFMSTVTNRLIAGNKAKIAYDNAIKILGSDDGSYRLPGDNTRAVPHFRGKESFSPDYFGEYSTTVIDQEPNTPLADVNVKAIDTANNVVSELTTDSTGKVYFLLPEGQYTIVYSKEGYYTASFTETIMRDEHIKYDVVGLSEQDESASYDFIMPVTRQTTVPEGYTGIYTPQDLNNMRNNLSGNYILMNDIDLADWGTPSNGNWTPIGRYISDNPSEAFSGIFDGNSYVVKNLTIAGSAGSYAGLFGFIYNSTITNVGLVNTNISVLSLQTFAGGIAGDVRTSIINNCFNTGNISGSSTSSWYSDVGGIAGRADNTTIKNCYNTGHIGGTTTAFSLAGGILGYGTGLVTTCYNTGLVNGGTAGGIAGQQNIVEYCFNTGNIKGGTGISNYAGGITGYGSEKISYCYNAGEVSSLGGRPIGGIAGGIPTYLPNGGIVATCFYANTIDKAVGEINNATLSNVIALSIAQMKQQASFISFDFTNVWAIDPAINNGYPYLRGMQP